jgi:kinesin family protein 12
MDNTSAKVVVRLKRDQDHPEEPTIGFENDECETELLDVKITDEGTKVHVNTTQSSANAQVFRCNHSFLHGTPQEAFFVGCEIVPMLDGVIVAEASACRNACIMAYGQTGSGKTYTLFGSGQAARSHSIVHAPAEHVETFDEIPSAHCAPADGLIVRSIEHLFNLIDSTYRGAYSIKLSSIEICDDQVYDLLSGSNTLPVAVREHPNDGYSVHCCQFIECTDLEVAMAAVELVARHRRGRHVSSPRHSQAVTSDVSGIHKVARSHNITEVWVCATTTLGEDDMSSRMPSSRQPVDTADGPLRVDTSAERLDRVAGGPASPTSPLATAVSKLTFVDLAGSERFKPSGGSIKARMASTKFTYKSLAVTDVEVGTINPSLYVLGRVIAGLVRSHNNIHSRDVPYKESVLTKLLIQTISRSYHTHSNMIIACVHEAKCHEAETLRTLKFVTSCANVYNAAPVKLSKQDKLIVELKMNIKRVKQENTEMRRTILSTPSWGDKVLAHLSPQELESTLAFAHADAKLKPQVKDVRKDISATTKSEKKRSWTSWKMFERNVKNKGTVVINVGAMGKSGAQVHPGDEHAADATEQHFPFQHRAPAHDHVPHSSHTQQSLTEKHLAAAKQSVQLHFGAHLPPSHEGTHHRNGHHGTAPNSVPGSANAYDHNGSLDSLRREDGSSTQQRESRSAAGPDGTLAQSSATFTRESRVSSASQQEMDDLVRRRATGPIVFRSKAGENIDPILESTLLDRGDSAVVTMRMAELQKSQEMKAFVQEQCKNKGVGSLISPYICKRPLHFYPRRRCVLILCCVTSCSALGAEEGGQGAARVRSAHRTAAAAPRTAPQRRLSPRTRGERPAGTSGKISARAGAPPRTTQSARRRDGSALHVSEQSFARWPEPVPQGTAQLTGLAVGLPRSRKRSASSQQASQHQPS